MECERFGQRRLRSTSTVTDNAWQYAVLSCDVDSQALFLDGTKQDTFAGTPADQSNTLTYIGAGFAKSWTASPGSVSYFKSSIADVAFYDHNLTSAQVAPQGTSYKQSTGAIATESVDVTDPGGNSLTRTYDLSNGGRILTETDGTGATTSYGYDTAGFLYTTTDGNGNVTTTGHNTRGDVVPLVRTCLLTSTDADTTGTWAGMQEIARTSGSKVVVQRYRLTAGVDPVASAPTPAEGVRSDSEEIARTAPQFLRHWGGLPCLRFGRSPDLAASIAIALLSVRRVSRGSITSSSRPRSAA